MNAHTSPRRCARGFGPVDLDDAADRQAADSERFIEVERPGWDRVIARRIAWIAAERHDGALAKALADRSNGIANGLAQWGFVGVE
jgi:hypothetical protein